MAKELLFSITKKDIDIQFFSGTGAGGQYRNKHQNCVRMIHKDSGVMVTGQSNRERTSNIKEAFNNLINSPKFKLWHNAKIKEIIDGKTLQQRIEESINNPKNIKIEGKDENNKWIELNLEQLTTEE